MTKKIKITETRIATMVVEIPDDVTEDQLVDWFCERNGIDDWLFTKSYGGMGEFEFDPAKNHDDVDEHPEITGVGQ